MDTASIAIAAVPAYLLGSVPFGILMARIFGLGDLRRIGSGNIGATNVLRTGNRAAAALTLAGDAGKGAAAVFLARWWAGEEAAVVAGTAAVIGHLYPVFLIFKGGKGVATFLGMLLALSFPAGLAACMTWLAVAAVFRFSSLSALAAAAMAPFYAWHFHYWQGAAAAGVLAALVFIKHAANIRRLLDGTEPRIGSSK